MPIATPSPWIRRDEKPVAASMAKCVAQIEQGTLARFALVTRHDIGFHPAGMGNHMDLCGLVAGQRSGAILFKPREKFCIAQRAVFDHFGIARQQLALG